MQTKNLLGIVLLSLWAFSFIGCSKDVEIGDKVQNVKMYISAETSTYQPEGITQPIECMLSKEEGQTDFQKLDFLAIRGFEYENGYEYTLSVEKKTLLNPPADGSSISYKLIEILSRKWISTPEPPQNFTEDDIKYKEGCPYHIYDVVNPEFSITSDGQISDSKQKYSYKSSRIYLDYVLGNEDKYYNKILYMTTQAFVIDPLMNAMDSSLKISEEPSNIRLIRVSDSGPLIKNVLTEEEYEFIKAKATIGQKFTYKLILLNAERLGLQDVEITFTKI